MAFYTKKGTGRATCKFCGNKILKGEVDLIINDYRIEWHIHSSAFDCNKQKRMCPEE